MTVTYEDEAGKISKAEKELQLEVAEAVETTEWDEADMKPAPFSPSCPWRQRSLQPQPERRRQ